MTSRSTWLAYIAGIITACVVVVGFATVFEQPSPACKPYPLTTIHKQKAVS